MFGGLRIGLLVAGVASYALAEVGTAQAEVVPNLSTMKSEESLAKATVTTKATSTSAAVDLAAAQAAAQAVQVPLATSIPALATFSLLPPPSPGVVSAFFAVLIWISIFFMGCCALSGVSGQAKLVERGLVMAKEY